ncbi:MAG: 5'-nucleotidase C-terminal domain-containing protein [Pseudomonadota bacterium]
MPIARLTRTLTAAAFALGATVAISTTSFAETFNLTLITASDMDTMSEDDGRGGVARLASVITSERAKGGEVLFAFPGDLLSPSILAGFDQGEHMVELLNMTKPDMFTPGNHEFDFGAEVFLKRMKGFDFPVLGTNIRRNGAPVEGLTDSFVKEYEAGGEMLKVGFIGLTTADTVRISSPGDISFLPVVETAKAAAEKLRADGVDVVVAALHTHQAEDFSVIQTAGVDIVLSGHDHNLHIFFDGRVALMEAKEESEYVAIMDLAVDVTTGDRGRRVRWWPNFRIIDTATVEPDAAVGEKVAAYEATLSKELDVDLGKSEVPLDTRRVSVRTGENAFGNLTADAMRAAVDADVGFTNGGGIRGNRQYDAGHTLTRRDVLTELPFGNGTVKLEVTGQIILDALEHGYRGVPEPEGSFLHISGMTAEIDTSKTQGSRVSNVMIGGEPLDPAATYTLATNDFMARGGDGYSMLGGGKVLIDAASAKLMANDVMVRVRELGSVTTGIDGRLTIK